jgi:F0F1-type ATP synthase assembly protein I
MITNYLTFFTDTFQANYDPIHLILGGSIGIIAIVIIIKKIIGMKNKK